MKAAAPIIEAIRVEFHCHTSYSGDSLTTPEKLIAACLRKRIDRVVVTDHNTITGALAAQEVDPELVIVGEEIMTLDGELLAFYVKEEVPPGLSPNDTIDILRDQGAFISVSHPFDRMRKGGWELPSLLKIAPLVDALETFNSRCMLPSYNRKALAFARERGMLATVGSDAHLPYEIGRATTLMPEFHDAASLIEALKRARHQVRLSGAWVHLFSRYAKWRKRASTSTTNAIIEGL